jgi:phosphoribosylpyrophosphate synthetase
LTAVEGQVRDGERFLVTVQAGDCAGRHVMIVDDLVQASYLAKRVIR